MTESLASHLDDNEGVCVVVAGRRSSGVGAHRYLQFRT
jgi:hypothetical protein